MLESKIEKRIEGRYEVIKECLETIYQQLSEIYASLESIQILSFYKEDLKKEDVRKSEFSANLEEEI